MSHPGDVGSRGQRVAQVGRWLSVLESGAVDFPDGLVSGDCSWWHPTDRMHVPVHSRLRRFQALFTGSLPRPGLRGPVRDG